MGVDLCVDVNACSQKLALVQIKGFQRFFQRGLILLFKQGIAHLAYPLITARGTVSSTSTLNTLDIPWVYVYK